MQTLRDMMQESQLVRRNSRKHASRLRITDASSGSSGTAPQDQTPSPATSGAAAPQEDVSQLTPAQITEAADALLQQHRLPNPSEIIQVDDIPDEEVRNHTSNLHLWSE